MLGPSLLEGRDVLVDCRRAVTHCLRHDADADTDPDSREPEQDE